MVETPSAVKSLFNDSGEMPNSYSMVVAPMKFCVTIWEEFTVKINITPKGSNAKKISPVF